MEIRHVIVVSLMCIAFSCASANAQSTSNMELSNSTSTPHPLDGSTPHQPPAVNTPRDVYNQLDSSVHYIYQMTDFFLDTIIQPNYLTKMNSYLNETMDFGSQFTTYWEEWIVYLLGFVICAGIGCVLFVGMLLAGPIVGCCRCCCHRCGSKKSCCSCCCCGRSRGCCVLVCSTVLLVITAGVLFGAVPLVTLNDELHRQIHGDYIVNVDRGLGQVLTYTDDAVQQVNDVCYDGYVRTEAEVFTVLEQVPDDVLVVFDNLTSIVRVVTQLDIFSAQLGPLLGNLTVANATAVTLDGDSNAFWKNDLQGVLDSIRPILINDCTVTQPTPALCDDTIQAINDTHIATNFTAVNLEGPITDVTAAVDYNMTSLVQSVSGQIASIPDQVNATMYPSIDSAKQQSDDAKRQMLQKINDLNGTLYTPIADFRATMIDARYNDVVEIVAVSVYWVLLVLAIVMFVVSACNVVGVVLGVALPSARAGGRSKAVCTKSVGAVFLMLGSVLVFIIYWLVAGLVAVAFVAGGVAHTEVCRHVIAFDQSRSAAVLDIFDRYAAAHIEIDPNYKMRPFQVYGACSRNLSLYAAFDIGQNPDWNLATIVDYEELKKAVEQIKATQVDLPPVNLTNPTLLTVLEALDGSFSRLNFTSMYAAVNTSIVQPDIHELVANLKQLNFSDLTDLVRQLDDLVTSKVDPMAEQQKVLVSSLVNVEAIVGAISFSDISRTLTDSEAAINTNGSVVASQYINDTADVMYVIMTRFVNATVDSLESELGRCEPFYQGVTTIMDATCVTGLYPLNGLWYNFGWCLVFLIPSLVFAMNLATIFRQKQAHAGRKYETSDDQRHLAEDGKMTNAASAAAAGATNHAYHSDDISGVENDLPPDYRMSTVSDKIPAGESVTVVTPGSAGEEKKLMQQQQSAVVDRRDTSLLPPDYD